MVVGFADLTGSTALVQRADLAGLDRAITRFEETTSDLIARAGATLVKRLGDGVMFVAAEPEAALALALDVVAAFPAGGETPSARVGLAAGHVVALRGDFYGPAVHLAARLADAAAPATVLAAPDLRARAGEGRGRRVPRARRAAARGGSTSRSCRTRCGDARRSRARSPAAASPSSPRRRPARAPVRRAPRETSGRPRTAKCSATDEWASALTATTLSRPPYSLASCSTTGVIERQ
jgi:class 3 adenylate cyclase